MLSQLTWRLVAARTAEVLGSDAIAARHREAATILSEPHEREHC